MSSAWSASQELHGRCLGGENGCGEIVRLDPLSQIVAEVCGVGVVEGEVAQRLQDDAASLPNLQPTPVGDENDLVATVRDTAS